MRMMAALARAGAVIAATRPRRAAPVVLAHMGVCALAVVAVAAMPAVVIDAALGADARPVVEIVATDQTVAAVDLRAVIDRSHPARASFGTAARVIIDTNSMAAFLALAALPVAHVIGAVRATWAIGVFVALAEIAMSVFAIPEIALALGIFTTERAVRSCLAFPTAEMVGWALRIDRAAFIVRDAIAIAAAPPLDAVVGADPLIAERASLAIVIVAAFLAGAASARCAAEQILAAVALGAGAVRNGAGVARFAAAGPNRDATFAAAFLVRFAGVDAAAGGADVARFRTRMVGVAACVVLANTAMAGSAGFLGAVVP